MGRWSLHCNGTLQARTMGLPQGPQSPSTGGGPPGRRQWNVVERDHGACRHGAVLSNGLPMVRFTKPSWNRNGANMKPTVLNWTP